MFQRRTWTHPLYMVVGQNPDGDRSVHVISIATGWISTVPLNQVATTLDFVDDASLADARRLLIEYGKQAYNSLRRALLTDLTKHDHAAAGYLPVYSDITGRDLYIGPDAGPGALYDQITDRLGHIGAMICQACCAAGETFRETIDTLQDKFLAAVAQKVNEVQVMAQTMYERG